MRVTIKVDSATPQEIWNLTAAFQRTAGIPLPPTATTKPMVTVAGSAMGWESPAMTVERAEGVMAEWKALREADRKLVKLEERLPVSGSCGCSCNDATPAFCGDCGHEGCGLQ